MIVKRPRVVAIVQARTGSSRLPGKVLKEIAGKPLLWHVVHRLRQCRTLDAVAIATTIEPRDEAIAAFCRGENVLCVRGSEDDVLARFALAARTTRADIVVRVSSDVPFLDPDFVDRLVDALIEQDGDYVTVPEGSVCAHEGVDPMSRRALEKLIKEVPGDKIAREHVSGYFKVHPDFVRVVRAAPDPRFAVEGTRLTVDTPDDLAFVQSLYARMQAKAGEASLADLLALLEREPRLKSANAHVRQKRLGAESGTVLIRCDGGGALGYGHVKRSLTLARNLRDREGFGVTFALNGEREAADTVERAGFACTLLPDIWQVAGLARLVGEKAPDILVCDARQNISREVLARIGANVPVVAVIDDASDRRLAATHAYYPAVPQAEALAWSGPTVVRIGWQWALLGFDPAVVKRGRPRDGAPPAIVVSMGGSDPMDLTRLSARALAKISIPFRARFVIGPGVRNGVRLAREIEAMSPAFAAVQEVADIGAEFAAADVALVAFGVTAYELAALGVPALYLALTDDHALSASAFEAAGMGQILGLARVVRAEEIARPVWGLLSDAERRRDMRAAGLMTVDGRAGERIAADLAQALGAARAAPAGALGRS
jgi:spore coat polysaccharide biosynthesis protein SpsF